MVNQTDGCLAAIDGDAANDIVGIVPVVDILQGVAIDNREVLHIESVNSVNIADHLVVGLLQRMLLGIGDTVLQGLVNSRSDSAFVLGQQGVTRALCQTVLVAHNVALHNLDLNAQMAYHRLDDGNLLPVLLAEIGTVG